MTVNHAMCTGVIPYTLVSARQRRMPVNQKGDMVEQFLGLKGHSTGRGVEGSARRRGGEIFLD